MRQDAVGGLLLKLKSDGTTATDFGLNGFTELNFGTSAITKQIILRDGFFYVLMQASVSGQTQLVIAKVLNSGILDTTFHDAGFFALPWSDNQSAYAINAVVDKQDRLVIYMGVRNGFDKDIGITRFCLR